MTKSDKESMDLIRSTLKCCPNFPKQGVTFMYLFFSFLLNKY